MIEVRRFSLADWLLLVLVLLAAGGARAGYLLVLADSGQNAGPLFVQEPVLLSGTPPRSEQEVLANNIKDRQWFGSPAPLASSEEQTAHVAPGYPWLLATLAHVVDPSSLGRTVRWLQCGLGTLTAGLFFLFARRAFGGNRVAATLAGLLTAADPFAVIATATLEDGVVVSFLLALAVFLGTWASQMGVSRSGGTAGRAEGGPFASLLYGLALAGLALTRAALLPFAFVAICWFLLRSRTLGRGWLCALLAFLGFLNGLAPWTFRNYQTFGEVVPVVDSAYLHLWIGNNPQADGGPATEAMLHSPEVEKLAEVKEQPRRYDRLGDPLWQEVRSHPVETLRRRLQAGLDFLFGARWFVDGRFALFTGEGQSPAPELLGAIEVGLQTTMLVMLLLGLLGWRWSYGWRLEAMPLSLAMVWIPLPYLLGHADLLSGPRLPLDGVLLTYAALALACLLPGGGRLFQGSMTEERA
jgi:hypothetical protein